MSNLMHNLLGMAGLQNAVSGSIASSHNAAQQTAIFGQYAEKQRQSMNKKLFDGRIEVLQVANGFVVNIASKDGYEYVTHIASSITEVNEIIAAQIVVFKLEDKS